MSAETTAGDLPFETSPKTLDRATFFVVHPRKNPLGSMARNSWEDTVAIMKGWLQPDAPLTAYAVDATERLLERLIYETATTRPNSLLRQERDLIIAQWQPLVLKAWIDVAQGLVVEQDPSLLEAAIARAEAALERIVEWYNQGGCFLPLDHDPLPVASFLQVCQLWLQLDSPKGMIQSAQLLITWTEGEQETQLLEQHKVDTATVLNDTMNQSIQWLQRGKEVHGHPDHGNLSKMAAALVTRIDLLRDQAGWTELQDISPLARKVVLMESLQSDTATADDKNKTAATTDASRVFEETALFAQMTELIRTADKDDQDTIVKEVIPRLMASNNIPPSTARSMSAELVDFFVRVQNPKQATHWIQRLQVMDNTTLHESSKEVEDGTTNLNRLLSILELWIHSSDTQDAVWRADELLKRCEAIIQTQPEIEADILQQRGIYLKMLRMWSNHSKDPALRARKVQDVFAKMMTADPSYEFTMEDVKLIVASAVEAYSHNKNMPVWKEDQVQFLLNLVEKQNPIAEVKDEILGQLMESLQGNMTPKIYSGMRKLSPTPDGEPSVLTLAMLNSSLPNLRSTKERLDLIEELGGFKTEDSGWDLESYNTAIAVLLRNEYGNDESFEAGKRLLGIALDRLQANNLDCATVENDVDSVVFNALDHCMTLQPNLNTATTQRTDMAARTALAHEILVSAENTFLSKEPDDLLGTTTGASPISLQCFQKVLAGFRETNQSEPYVKTFHRLYDYFKIGGYHNLLPDGTIMAEYLHRRRLAGIGSQDAKEVERLLQEWRGHCQDSGLSVSSSDLKGLYNRIFWAHYNQSNGVGAVEFAKLQLAAMSRSGNADDVELRSFLIGQAIRTACDTKTENLYDLLVKRLFRLYGMDEKLQSQLQADTWRDLLYASSTAPRDDFAPKLAIMALTELRKAGRADHWTYNRMVATQLRQGGPTTLAVLEAVFHSCCEDGCLSPSLKRTFYGALGQQVWQEVYTSRLGATNGQEPMAWSAKLSEEDKTVEKVFFAEVTLRRLDPKRKRRPTKQ